MGEGGGSRPLQSEWTREKEYSLDWSNIDDIVAHQPTLTSLHEAHPRLAAVAPPTAELIALFLRYEPARDTERRKLLRDWANKKLFDVRKPRWCRICGREGHTKVACPGEVASGRKENPVEIFRRRQAEKRASSALAAADESVDKSSKTKPVPKPAKLQAKTMAASAPATPTADGPSFEGAPGARATSAAQVGDTGVLAAEQAVETQAAVHSAREFVGHISRVDPVTGHGAVTVQREELRFFKDNLEFGLKAPRLQTPVRFRREMRHGEAKAIEIRPLAPQLTADDLRDLARRCEASDTPLADIRFLLEARHAWANFVDAVALLPDEASRHAVVAAIIKLTTYRQNQHTIDGPVLGEFLSLLAEPCSISEAAGKRLAADGVLVRDIDGKKTDGAAAAPPTVLSFFPDLTIAVIPSVEGTAAATALQAAPELPDMLMELSELVLLIASRATKGHAASRRVAGAIKATAAALLPLAEESGDRTVAKKLRWAIGGATGLGAAASVEALLLPTATEMQKPPTHRQSPFAPRQLPIVARRPFQTPEDHIRAHCRLLKADTFHSLTRVLGAAVFDLPGNRPDRGTADDVCHTRFYRDALHVGRVMIRDRDNVCAHVLGLKPMEPPTVNYKRVRDTDSDDATAGGGEGDGAHDSADHGGSEKDSQPDAVVQEVKEEVKKEAPAPVAPPFRYQQALEQGQFVVISTGIDRTAVDQAEIFWGIVAVQDPVLLQRGAAAIFPYQSDFTRLAANLKRNAEQGRGDRSIVMETSVFIQGYGPVQRALQQFLGPRRSPVPLADVLVGERPPAAMVAFAGQLGAEQQLKLVQEALSSGLAIPKPKPKAKKGKAAVAETEAEGDAAAPEASVAERLSAAEAKLRDAKAAVAPYADANTELVPPYYSQAFDDCVSTVCEPLVLDAGQAGCIRQLRRCPVVLVQGPPGTGKSFIGCRVVEALVRYKHDLSSGAALPRVNVAKLPNCEPATLTPDIGPVVVITFKNHALDEFLIDMVRSPMWSEIYKREQLHGSGTTAPLVAGEGAVGSASLVRIGGRSAESELAKYNINEILHRRQVPREVVESRMRVGILSRTIERLENEIRQLEAGLVFYPWWTTSSQAETFDCSPATLQAWLAGAEYISDDKTPAKPLSHYLGTTIGAILRSGQSRLPTPAPEGAAEAKTDADDGVQLSVFAAMKAEFQPPNRDLDAVRTSIIPDELHAAEPADPAPGALAAAAGAKFGGASGEVLSLWTLSPARRVEYFAFLIRRTTALKAREHTEAVAKLRSAVLLVDHARDRARLDLLRSVDIIGLTTTGCAMHQSLLQSLKPSVLVVEEAAEILESQLLACMTNSLKQVVLIGDHYQLKPKVETHELERGCGLNVSLFERLVRRVPPVVLVEQRRMRTAIADMVRPFYKTQQLRDHQSITDRQLTLANGLTAPRVPGLQKDVFLWQHDVPEEVSSVGRSKVNVRELALTRCLVRHLLREGVRPKSIAVITPYLGQRRAVKEILRGADADCADVRVATVDRFQGDEADVIILSLVRTQSLTEFMRMRNRMIVACSRARFGMVMLGNSALLRRAPHWAQLLDGIAAHGAISTELPITVGGVPHMIPNDATKFEKWPQPVTGR